MSDLENRIAALEAKLGRYGQPRIQFRLVFVDPVRGTVAVSWIGGDGDPRDAGPNRRWFHRADDEAEPAFLARVENSTQKQEA